MIFRIKNYDTFETYCLIEKINVYSPNVSFQELGRRNERYHTILFLLYRLMFPHCNYVAFIVLSNSCFSIGMFHNVLFLGPGGRTVFQGDVEEAERYFGGLGFAKPENVNPADYYMDVIGGQHAQEGVDKSKLFENYESYQSERDSRPVAANSDSYQTVDVEDNNRTSLSEHLLEDINVEMEQPGGPATQG